MPNPLCHFEFLSRDVARSRAFYGEVFDWAFDDASMPGYTLVQPGIEPGGGMMSLPEGSAARPALMVYFSVDDVAAAAERVREHGGAILSPPTTLPNNVGQYAIVADPDQVVFGLFKAT